MKPPTILPVKDGPCIDDLPEHILKSKIHTVKDMVKIHITSDYYPYAPGMEYLPTFAIKITQFGM